MQNCPYSQSTVPIKAPYIKGWSQRLADWINHKALGGFRKGRTGTGRRRRDLPLVVLLEKHRHSADYSAFLGIFRALSQFLTPEASFFFYTRTD